MSEINGLAVYKLLKLDPNTCSIPIIFVTDKPSMKRVVQSQIAEDIKLITKPINMSALTNQIIDLCNSYLITNN